MRKVLAVISAALFLGSVPASAGPASPLFTTAIVVSASTYGCHWIFQPGAPMVDDLIIDVEVRDALGTPLPGCTVTTIVVPIPGTGTANACPLVVVQTMPANAAGVARFSFENLRGCGDFQVDVRDAVGNLLTTAGPFTMTSSDLTGNGTVDIFDIAMFAGGLPPGYDMCADYNCDGIVNVFDLGIWASGVGGFC